MNDILKKFNGNTLSYTFLLVANIGLVWLLPYFPTRDGPSHVYNLVILQDLLNGGVNWGSFYTYKLQAVPNLGFHFFAYPLLFFLHPFAAEKLFISVYILLMGVSVPVFLKTFSKNVFPFAYFVFPVVFNYCTMMGFYSYVISVPLFLLALSASWRIRNSTLPYKIVCFNILAIILFYCHLIPAVLYLLSLVLIFSVEGNTLKIKISNLTKLFILITPSIFKILSYVYSTLVIGKHSKHSLRIPQSDLMRDLFTFSTTSFDPLQQQVGIILLFVFSFFFSVYLCRTLKCLYKKQIGLREVPQQEKFLVCFAFALVLLYFLAPFNFGEGSFFNQRFPWVIFLITLPLLRLPEQFLSIRSCSFVVVVVSVIFLACNANFLWQQSMIVKDFVKGTQVFIPRGSFIMLYKIKDPEWSRVDVLLHAASYVAIYKKSVDIGNYEAGSNLFPVGFQKRIPVLPTQDQIAYNPDTIKWENYPSIHYLLCLEIDDGTRKKLCRYFHVIRETESLSIWLKNQAIS